MLRSPFDWEPTDVSESTSGLPSRQLSAFTQPIGPVPRTTRENTSMKMLRLLVTDPILDSIVEQSRLLAIQKGDKSFDVSKEEVLAFIGINVPMGIIRLPRLRGYWSTSLIFSFPWFPAIMSRDRFFKISRYFHLVDATKQEKKGRKWV